MPPPEVFCKVVAAKSQRIGSREHKTLWLERPVSPLPV